MPRDSIFAIRARASRVNRAPLREYHPPFFDEMMHLAEFLAKLLLVIVLFRIDPRSRHEFY
jgi:hypothetical protein